MGSDQAVGGRREVGAVAVTITNVQSAGPQSWLVEWSSTLTDPTYYVWVDGSLASTTTATSSVFPVSPGESLSVEVFDSSTDTAVAPCGGRATLAWYPAAGAVRYTIDEYVGGAWVERSSVLESGAGYYRWRTRHLEDSTTHQFRITAQGDGDVDGTAADISWLMVRVPDPPDVDYTYDDETNTVTIS